MRRIPDAKRDTLTDFVLDHVAPTSGVRTDAWTGYDKIGRYRFDHVVANMSSSGDAAHVALPHVHLVASLLKRSILDTQRRDQTRQTRLTSTSSPSASTAGEHVTAASSSTDCSRVRWPPNHTPYKALISRSAK